MKTDIVYEDEATERSTDAAEQLRFWRRSIAKHKWSALGLALVVALLTALVVFSMTPIYRATTTLLIEASKAKVVSIEEVYNGTAAGGIREYFQTQAEILKGRELAEKLVRKLNLTTHPALDPRQAVRSPWLPKFGFSEKAPPAEDEIFDAVVRKVSNSLEIHLVRNSQLVKISFESPDRQLAATVPNVLAEIYIETDLDGRLQMTQKATAWLTERLGGLRAKVTSSERALQDYRERERIIDAKNVAMSGAAKQLEELSAGLVSARKRRAEAENAYNQVQAALAAKSSLESIPAVLRDPLVQRLREAQAEAERKLAEYSKRYGSENPRLAQAQTELKTARDNTRAQIDVVVAGITKEYEVARANEQSTEKVLSQSKSDIQSINRKEFQLGVLERDVAANRQLYDMFMTRARETNVAGDLQSTVARVVDPAVVPRVAVSPRKGLAISVALAVGLVLGTLLAFLLEYLDNTVKSSEDVEQKLGLPLLGILQRLRTSAKDETLQRAVLADSKSVFSEAVRTIRTSVMMSALDAPHKVILVTSSVPEEGKTTVAMNLAFAFAQVRKVCLIDADLRRPSIGKALALDRKLPGLSNLVSGTEEPSKCIHFDTAAGLHIIPAGASHPNPQELLSARRFTDVMKKLHEMFDIVVIDSPPVQLMSDSLILSSHANAVVYVVKADSTPYQVAGAGIDRLRKVGAPLLGVVLNQLDLSKADKYYGYGKYSAYGRYSYYRKGYSHYGYREKDKAAA